MKQIVILSGKGGTGKTSVAAAFAHLAWASSQSNDLLRTVLVDADVDASNLELVLSPQMLETHEFRGGQIAIIDQGLCEGCGACAELCRFDAIRQEDGVYAVDPIACEGCALCFYQCPSEAIRTEEQVAGAWFRSDSRYGPLFHAALAPGQENSGKLVTLVKQQGRLLALDEARDLVLVDGPPGIGCPVISAAAGADLALIVAEPTAAGIHDMARVLETTQYFGVPALVCINKYDLYAEGTARIEAYCREADLTIVGRLPFDTAVTEAMVQGQPVTAFDPDRPISQELRAVWERVLDNPYWTAVKDQE
jgi:MinD superfamily P-loop ATPase